MKTVNVTSGPKDNRQSVNVQLNHYDESDPLSPAIARAAIRIAGYLDGRVMDLDAGTCYRVDWKGRARKVNLDY